MTKFNDILRLHYLFSILIPMFAAVYANNLMGRTINILNHLDIFAGFAMLGITGNTWNDYVDMQRKKGEIETKKRTEGYIPNDLLAVGFLTLILGTVLLSRTAIQHQNNMLYLILTVIFVLLYIKVFKPVPGINHLLLGISHLVFPYLILLTDAGFSISAIDIIVIIGMLLFGLAGQLMHEIMDGDSITKSMSPKNYRRLVVIFGIICTGYGLFLFYVTRDIYLIPLPVIPLALIWSFRGENTVSKKLKELGLIAGNIIMFYIIVLIILQMQNMVHY